MTMFVIRSVTAGFLFGFNGKWVRHPIAARWFPSYDEADALSRRECSRYEVAVKALTEDRHRIQE